MILQPAQPVGALVTGSATPTPATAVASLTNSPSII